MTPDEAVALARAGDLDALGRERASVTEAVLSFVRSGDSASALELFGRTWRIWLVSGDLDGGAAVARAALDAATADTASVWRVRCLTADGTLAFRAGDADRALRRNEEALRVARISGDVLGQCEALTGLARLALRDGRYDDVIELAGRGRELAQAAGDRAAEASPLHLNAAGVRLRGSYRAARDLYAESLALNEELGNAAWQSMELDCLGWVELHLGNVVAAQARFAARDSLLGSDPYANAWSQLCWAAVATERGDAADARTRFDAASKALQALNNRLDPDDQAEYDWVSERLAALET